MKNTLSPDCVQCMLKLTHYYQGRAGASMALDDQFAMMIDQLKKNGKLKNTLIIFTSDNGWLMGQHNINGNKYLPYKESTHVPLMIAGPGVPKRKTNDALVANVDLTPTIVAASGAKARRVSDGMSLFPVMKNPAKGRSAIPLEATRKLFVKPGNFPNAENIPYYGVRTKDFMYARYVDSQGNFSADSPEEMYNLVADPFEMTNLVARPTASSPAKLAELRKLALELKSCKGKACVR